MNADRDDCPTFDCDDELPGQTTLIVAEAAAPANGPTLPPPSEARRQALADLDADWDRERRRHVASRRLTFPYRKSGVPNGLYLTADGAIHGVLAWLVGGELIAERARIPAPFWWAGVIVLIALAAHFATRAVRYLLYQRALRRYLGRRGDLARWDGRAESRRDWLAR